MNARIHPTALIDSSAELGAGVEIGAWAIVGPQCVIGDGCVISARATIERNARLGQRVKVGIGSIVGGDGQDLKYRGEETWVEIGDDTALREYVTVNRGTAHSLTTTVGKNCFLMSYSHVGHDCRIGDHVIISNTCQLGGHVTIDDHASIGGMSAVHQFGKVGRYGFVGGCSRVTQDVPPFVRATGNPIKLYGLNSVGLQRNGFDAAVIAELKRAYRYCFRSELNLSQGIERARAEVADVVEVRQFLEFIEASQRGVAF